MEIITLQQDIKVFYVTAKDFPHDIPQTYQKLSTLISGSSQRKYFGISYPNNQGAIIYKAAAEELEKGEAALYSCETFTIKKGQYRCITIKNHMENGDSIGMLFKPYSLIRILTLWVIV